MSSNKRGIAAPLMLALGLGLGASFAAWGALDLAALEVTPQRGQSAEQARRDRFECHNWAVEQTGVTPVAAPGAEEDRSNRAERAVNGALIGGAVGGLIRASHRKRAANGALAGAAVGAAVGAATGRNRGRDALDEDSQNYLRALSACLEGRGYRVTLPGADEQSPAAASFAAAR